MRQDQDARNLDAEMCQQILESIGYPAFFFCRTGLIQANRAFYEYIGLSQEQFAETRLRDFLHPDTRSEAMNAYRRLLADPESTQTVAIFLIMADQTTSRAVLTMRAAPYAGADAQLGMLRDVTSEDLLVLFDYPSLLDSLPIGVYRTGGKGEIIYANSALAQLLGYESIDALKQHKMSEHYVDQKRRSELIDMWRKDKTATFFQEHVWRKNTGEEFWVHVTGSIIWGEDDEVEYF